MAYARTCEQCGMTFTPLREHARFCSARCRVAWNRCHASDPTAETRALGWSIAAMEEATDRLQEAADWDRADGFVVVSEAVWGVTIVDAAMMRYHPDIYGGELARQDSPLRRMTENTFAGLRFVRNRMGYHAGPADFIQPLAPRIAAWTWKPVPEPALDSLTPHGQEWEMTRYRAYRAQLAGHAIGETFSQAVAFLRRAADRTSLSRA